MKTVITISILIPLVIILLIASIYFKPFLVQGGKKILTVGSETFEVGVADNALTRAKGLSGRPSLGDKEGLFFVFPSAGNYGFWMKDMNFPIDIIWIRDGKVTGFSENLQPEPDKSIFNLTVYYPPGYADSVLELNAGAVKKYNIQEGDAINLGE